MSAVLSNSVHNKYLEDDDDSSIESETVDIHEIVRTGNIVEIKEALARDRPRLIALKDGKGRQVLHHAAMCDRMKVCLYLISKNADVNARDDFECTPLHYAAQKGFTEMCRFLLDFHANIRMKDTNCWTALHHAVDSNFIETATLLIKRGAALNPEDHKFGRTPLHLAAEKGYDEMVEMLITRGADLCAKGDAFFSKTPLHLACINGHAKTVEVLVKRGSEINALSGLLDKSPLHFAAEKGHVECAKVLLENGAAINACGQCSNGATALHLAAECNQWHIVQLLIDFHADINILGKFSTIGSPMHIAAKNNFPHIIHLLFNNQASLDTPDINLMTPLHTACKCGQYDIAALLIDLGADYKLKTLQGKTPLQYCAHLPTRDKLQEICDDMDKQKDLMEKEKKFRKLVEEERQKKLLRASEEERRADEAERQRQEARRQDFLKRLSGIVDVSGEHSAFVELAMEYPDKDINEVLTFETGWDGIVPGEEIISLPSQFKAVTNQSVAATSTSVVTTGPTLLQITDGTEPAVAEQQLVRLEVQKYQCTAIIRAASRGFDIIVKALLQWPGININAQDTYGNTALHHAAYNNQFEIIEDLLLIGAKYGILNIRQRVAANYAKRSSTREILRKPGLIVNRRQYQDMVIRDIFQRRQGIEQASLSLQDALQEESLLQSHEDVLEQMKTAFGKTSGNSNAAGTSLPVIVINPVSNTSNFNRPKSSSRKNNAGSGNASTWSLPAIPNTLLSPSKTQSANGAFSPPASPSKGAGMHPALIAKYGEIPKSFGGCRADFFQLVKLREAQTYMIGGVSFMDIFTLQRSYRPSAFDHTDEWCEVKDFLWLLGYPHRILSAAQVAAGHEDSQQNNNQNNNYQVEKRSILYNMGVAMDNLQKVYITPTHMLATSHLTVMNQEEVSAVNEIQDTFIAKHFPKNLSHDDFLRLQVFSDYCLQFFKEFLRLYDTYSVDYYDYLSRKEKIEYYHTHIAYLRDHHYIDQPTAEILEALLPYCDVLSHTYEVPIFINGEIRSSEMNTNLKRTASMRKKSRKPEKEEKAVDASAATPSSPSEKHVRFGDGIEDVADEMEIEMFHFQDPLKSIWSELVLNPPRALRKAVDCIYELAHATMKQAETAYANDAVRANLWGLHGRQILQVMTMEEVKRQVKLQQQYEIMNSPPMIPNGSSNLFKEEEHGSAEPPSSNNSVTNHDTILNNRNIGDYLKSNASTPAKSKAANAVPETKESVEEMAAMITPLHCWFKDLELLEYEVYFYNAGFKLLDDFEELNDMDCYRFFPFLKVR